MTEPTSRVRGRRTEYVVGMVATSVGVVVEAGVADPEV